MIAEEAVLIAKDEISKNWITEEVEPLSTPRHKWRVLLRHGPSGLLANCEIDLARSVKSVRWTDIINSGAGCVWTSDDNGVWETDCGNAFQFTDDGPTENGIKFCPYCGRACKPVVTRFD